MRILKIILVLPIVFTSVHGHGNMLFHSDYMGNQYNEDHESYYWGYYRYAMAMYMYNIILGNWLWVLFNPLLSSYFVSRGFYGNNMGWMGMMVIDRDTREINNGIDAYMPMGPMMGGNNGDMPGYLIMQLFNYRGYYKFNYTFYDNNLTIVWTIKSNPELISLLERHILQMKSMLESGATPRPMDPVFVYEAKLSDYINTQVKNLGDTLIVIKTGENQCAYEIIKLHAKVVEGFFKFGREEAQRIHPVPDYVKELCRQYIS